MSEAKTPVAKATRASFGEALVELGAEFKNIVVLDADLSKSTKSEGFAKKYPERFFQMGIAEANMIGVAAGMAFTGKVPFLCSFGCFLTGRFDTIRVSVGYSNANVRLVGTHAGIGIGEDDIETKQMMRFLATHEGPVYLRLTRQNLEPVNKSDYKFQYGRGVELKSGTDAIVFATGGVVAHSLNAAHMLEKEGKSVGVVNIHTIKPLDVELVARLSKNVKNIFTAEDHNVIGGLGSAVAEVLAEQGLAAGSRLTRLGVQDTYGESGTPESLYKKHGLDADGLARSIKSGMNH
jgi:transketolase